MTYEPISANQIEVSDILLYDGQHHQNEAVDKSFVAEVKVKLHDRFLPECFTPQTQLMVVSRAQFAKVVR